MHIFLHKVEKFVDRIIPPLLLLLLVGVIGEIFFSEAMESYTDYMDALDVFVIIVFTSDLTFKYNKTRQVPKFLKKYWLEIIAVFPFFLIFRAVEAFRLSDLITEGQAVVHEGAEAEKEIAAAGKLAKESEFLRYFKIFSRSPRFLKGAKFYDKPTGQHYPGEKK
jgi:hypothetical protein